MRPYIAHSAPPSSNSTVGSTLYSEVKNSFSTTACDRLAAKQQCQRCKEVAEARRIGARHENTGAARKLAFCLNGYGCAAKRSKAQLSCRPAEIGAKAAADAAAFFSSNRSVAEGEIFLGHLHQVVGAGQHGVHMGTGTRQDACEVEAGSLQLGLVKPSSSVPAASSRLRRAPCRPRSRPGMHSRSTSDSRPMRHRLLRGSSWRPYRPSWSARPIPCSAWPAARRIP